MITENNVVIKTFSDTDFDEKIDENYKGILLFISETGYVKIRFSKPSSDIELITSNHNPFN